MDNRVHKDLLQASLWHFDERLRPALAGRRTFLLATGTAEQVERELLTALRRDLRRQRRRIVKDSPANGTSARVVRRLLGPTPLVAAGRRGAAMWPASDSPRKPCDRGDHGRPGRWTAGVNGRTLAAGRSGSPPADRKARRPANESGACRGGGRSGLCRRRAPSTVATAQARSTSDRTLASSLLGSASVSACSGATAVF